MPNTGSVMSLNFDDTSPNGGLRLVQNAYQLAHSYAGDQLTQYQRDYQFLNGYIDMARRDPSRAHVFIPKLWEIVRGKVPRDFKALFGFRPYIPFECRREDYKAVGQAICDMMDHYLVVHNMKVVGALATLLKTVYGTAYVESIPYYERVTRNVAVNQMVQDQIVGRVMMPQEVDLLRFSIRVYAPWEVFPDPFALNLEDKDSCRFVVHYQVASKRSIAKMAEQGAYPGLDVGKLASMQTMGTGVSALDDEGRKIMASLGMKTPTNDTDICILMRYQSPERYIDVINGMVVLRDVANPYGVDPETGRKGHGGINICRYIHIQDAHTQNQLRGIGEIKPNEVQQALLNDLKSQQINAFNFLAQPAIVYDEEAMPGSIVWEFGGRYGYKPKGRNLRADDVFQVHTGDPLPQDHYKMVEETKLDMDLTAQRWSIQRGEPTSGQRTLGEAGMLREAGDEPQELNITLAEQIFLKSFGEKFIAQLNQFGTQADVDEILEPGRAAMVMTLDPGQLPGGYHFTFKGADRISNILVQQRGMDELAPLLIQELDAGHFALARAHMQKHEMPENEINEILQEAQAKLMFQMQQQQMQAEQDAAMQQQQAQQDAETQIQLAKIKTGARGAKKSRTNTPGKTYGDQNRMRVN